jgi:hypothetical protein
MLCTTVQGGVSCLECMALVAVRLYACTLTVLLGVLQVECGLRAHAQYAVVLSGY